MQSLARTPAEHRIERYLFVFIVLLISCFLHFANGSASDTDADGGSALAQAVWGLVYAGAFAGLFVERRRAWALVRS